MHPPDDSRGVDEGDTAGLFEFESEAVVDAGLILNEHDFAVLHDAGK
jgi:hypothetical protein